jgi:hypothetical protein
VPPLSSTSVRPWHRSRNSKLKKGGFADEGSATTESDIEETLKRLVSEVGKSPEEVFEALKNQTVDLVFTAHPTQSARRLLQQKNARYIFLNGLDRYAFYSSYISLSINFFINKNVGLVAPGSGIV